MLKQFKIVFFSFLGLFGVEVYAQNSNADSAKYYVSLIIDCYKKGNIEKGLFYGERALKFEDWAIFHAFNATGYFYKGQYEKSKTECNFVINNPAAIKELPFMLLSKANVEGKLGNYDTAFRYYSLYEKINPRDIDLYYNRANLYLSISNYNLAFADCNLALKINPEKYEFFLLRGEIYRGIGENVESLKDYQYYTEHSQVDIDKAYYGKASTYMSIGNYLKAKKSLLKAIEIAPNNLDYIYQYWRILSITNNYEELYNELNTYSLDKNLPINQAYYYYKAKTFSNLFNDYDSSLIFIQRAIKLNPTDLINYYSLAQINLKKENYSEAIKYYNTLINKTKDTSFMYLCRCERAICYLKIENKNKEKEEIEKLLAIKSNNNYLLYGLGKYYEASNDYLKAVNCYGKCLEGESVYLAYSRMLHCLTELSDYDSVLVRYSLLSKENQLTFDDIVDYSRALIKTGNSDLAVIFLKYYTKYAQSSPSIYSMLSVAYLNIGKEDSSSYYLNLASKKNNKNWLYYYAKSQNYLAKREIKEFINTSEEGVKQKDHQAIFYNFLTMTYLRQFEVEKSKKWFEKLKTTLNSAEDTGNYLLDKALIFVFDREFKKANDFIDSIVPTLSYSGVIDFKNLQLIIKAIMGDLKEGVDLSKNLYELTGNPYYLKSKASFELLNNDIENGTADFLEYLGNMSFNYLLINQFSDNELNIKGKCLSENKLKDKGIKIKINLDTSQYNNIDLSFASISIDTSVAKLFYKNFLKALRTNEDKYSNKIYYHLLLAELMKRNNEISQKILDEYDKALVIDNKNPHTYILRGLYFSKILKQDTFACDDFKKATELGIVIPESNKCK